MDREAAQAIACDARLAFSPLDGVDGYDRQRSEWDTPETDDSCAALHAQGVEAAMLIDLELGGVRAPGYVVAVDPLSCARCLADAVIPTYVETIFADLAGKMAPALFREIKGHTGETLADLASNLPHVAAACVIMPGLTGVERFDCAVPA